MSKLPYRRNEFIEQEFPIYDFYLSPDNQLMMNQHRLYVKYDTPSDISSRPQYEYRISLPGGVCHKNSNQMDRYLNNHLFTLNPDKLRARQIIIGYYEQKSALAKETMEKCDAVLIDLRVPAMPLFTDTGGDSHD